MYLIKYRFGGKVVNFKTYNDKERDFFLKVLKDFGIKVLGIEFLLFT